KVEKSAESASQRGARGAQEPTQRGLGVADLVDNAQVEFAGSPRTEPRSPFVAALSGVMRAAASAMRAKAPPPASSARAPRSTRHLELRRRASGRSCAARRLQSAATRRSPAR